MDKIYKGGFMRIDVVSYPCLKCGKVLPIELRPNMTEKSYNLLEGMFNGKLCLSCYTDRKEAIEGAAENLMALH
jgi:hypothetical protein